MPLEHEHTPQAISDRLSLQKKTSYLRDWVYGGIDGAVTTFAVVSGVAGAELATGVTLILGLANLIADGFSMAASNYLGTQSDVHFQQHWESVERKHIAVAPEGEKEELRQIFQSKGLRGRTLDDAVNIVAANPDQWVNTMLSEEYGLSSALRKPLKSAVFTFVAFMLCGSVPLLPYVFGWSQSFGTSSVLTGLVFFAIGSLRSKWSASPWWKTGFSTFLIGSVAAALAYYVGVFLRSLGVH